MEEYKQYIHDKISQIPMHPTRMSESISINISEALWRRLLHNLLWRDKRRMPCGDVEHRISEREWEKPV